MKYSRTSSWHPIQIPIGLLIWSLWFVLLYGGLSVACAVAPPDPARGPWNWLNLALGLLTLTTLFLLLIMGWRFWRLSSTRDGLDERQIFVTRLASGMYLVAAIATLYVGIPLLLLPPCI